jgi:hypothetical protein
VERFNQISHLSIFEEIWRPDNDQNDIQHNDTRHNNKNATLRIILADVGCPVFLLSVVVLNVIKLSVVLLNVVVLKNEGHCYKNMTNIYSIFEVMGW